MHGDTFCIANSTVAAVPDRPVFIDFSHIGVAAVAHGPIALNFADIGIAAIAHIAITADFSDQAVAAVADIAVAIDSANVGVATIPYGAVILDLSNHRIAVVAYRLRVAYLSRTHRHKKYQRQDCFSEVFHQFFHTILLISLHFHGKDSASRTQRQIYLSIVEAQPILHEVKCNH